MRACAALRGRARSACARVHERPRSARGRGALGADRVDTQRAACDHAPVQAAHGEQRAAVRRELQCGRGARAGARAQRRAPDGLGRAGRERRPRPRPWPVARRAGGPGGAPPRAALAGRPRCGGRAAVAARLAPVPTRAGRPAQCGAVRGDVRPVRRCAGAARRPADDPDPCALGAHVPRAAGGRQPAARERRARYPRAAVPGALGAARGAGLVLSERPARARLPAADPDGLFRAMRADRGGVHELRCRPEHRVRRGHRRQEHRHLVRRGGARAAREPRGAQLRWAGRVALLWRGAAPLQLPVPRDRCQRAARGRRTARLAQGAARDAAAEPGRAQYLRLPRVAPRGTDPQVRAPRVRRADPRRTHALPPRRAALGVQAPAAPATHGRRDVPRATD